MADDDKPSKPKTGTVIPPKKKPNFAELRNDFKGFNKKNQKFTNVSNIRRAGPRGG